MSEHCGCCGGGLATFSQGLSGRADERSAGNQDGWWVRWVSASFGFMGSGASCTPDGGKTTAFLGT